MADKKSIQGIAPSVKVDANKPKPTLKDTYEIIIKRIKRGTIQEQLYNDGVYVLKRISRYDLNYALEQSREMYNIISGIETDDAEKRKLIVNTKKELLLFNAPYNFDCFLRYVEWNREYDKAFYPARRKALLPVVQAMQQLADDELDLLCVSLPPGVGKTALSIFFLCWLAGRTPGKSILGVSHSASFMRGVYDECLRIFDPKGEYLFEPVFPMSIVADTNAKDTGIDLEKAKRFKTLEFTSIGAGNAGKVRATQLLYCDDLVDGIETAMNKERLEKLWQTYTVDLRQRKIGNCKELHVATRWSVGDVIGRLEAENEGNPRAKFINVPALNEEDISNFDYGTGIDGFTTDFYLKQREIMDDVSWRALYMNQPIEREGLLYEADELKYYFDLPDVEPDSIVAVCDTKDRGKDYCVMPIAYQYGELFYIEDMICDNGKPEIIDERLVDILLRHKVKLCRFESNSAGGRTAEKVGNNLKLKGGITSISTKFTTANKETKIVVNSPFVKEHFLFKDKSVASKEYRKGMEMLCSYTMTGKNTHDDVPDAMSMLAEYVQVWGGNIVKVVKRPF